MKLRLVVIFAVSTGLLSASGCGHGGSVGRGGEGDAGFGGASVGVPVLGRDGDLDSSGPVDPETVETRTDQETGYSNPRTGHGAGYSLEVEYGLDGVVQRVTFPNGGWEDDFVSQVDNGDGTVTVRDEDGREFKVPAADAVD